MIPTTVFGAALLVAALAALLLPSRAPSGRVLTLLAAAVVGSGALGFAMGMTRVMTALAHPNIAADARVPILLAGTGECLSNLVLALVFVIPAALLGAGADLRARAHAKAAA